MVAAVAAWLLLWAAACAQREQDFYDFKAVNIRGKLVSLEKYRGSVSDRPLRAGRRRDRACRGRPGASRVRAAPPPALAFPPHPPPPPPPHPAIPPPPPPRASSSPAQRPRPCAGSVPRLRGTPGARKPALTSLPTPVDGGVQTSPGRSMPQPRLCPSRVQKSTALASRAPFPCVEQTSWR
jgi:hypothetical protein